MSDDKIMFLVGVLCGFCLFGLPALALLLVDALAHGAMLDHLSKKKKW